MKLRRYHMVWFKITSKKRLFLLGIVLFLIMCISGIYSLTNEMNKTESGLSTSAVDIEIKEYKQIPNPDAAKNIVVTGYGIQTEGLATPVTPASVWSNFS